MHSEKFPLYHTSGDQLELRVIEPVRKVFVLGHGALAEAQRPLYEHWIDKGVEVHCADIRKENLDDCVNGVKKYILPQEEHKFPSDRNYYDLLCINNYPEEHIISAIKFESMAKNIIIQKPQDLNYPLIKTISTSKMFADFRKKLYIQDHFRNKGSFPALLSSLPMLHRDYGQFRRIMLFLNEQKHINEESHRFGSLHAGMIQDLGVHMLDLLLECTAVGSEWYDNRESERKHQRVGGFLELYNCHKMRVANSQLGDDVETLAIMDFEVTDKIEYPIGFKDSSIRHHKYDLLIVVGKGLQLEENVDGDLKTIVAEYEIDGYSSWIDLKTQGVVGIQNYLPEHGREINTRHGGLNRPFMLISPEPPQHALEGLGGLNYSQWQDDRIAGNVAAIANTAQSYPFQRDGMVAYPHNRSLGDLLRELASEKIIRNTWNRLPKLSNYLIAGPLPDFR